MDRIERSAAVDVVKQWFPNGTVNDPKRPAGAGIIDDLNALPPARFTREDVEKAARKVEDVMGPLFGSPEYLADPVKRARAEKRRRDSAIAYATAALSAIGEVDHG